MRPHDFNNTQKINIGSHLECLDSNQSYIEYDKFKKSTKYDTNIGSKAFNKFNQGQNRVRCQNYQTNLNHTSTNKFKFMISKNKENSSKFTDISSI